MPISELKQLKADLDKARKDLKEAHRILQALSHASKETLLILDRKGGVIFANEEIGRRIGKDVTELVGRCIFDYFPAAVSRRRKKELARVFATGKPTYFEDTRGDAFYGTDSYPLFDEKGKVWRIGVFAREMTAAKKTEEDLRKSEIEYRTMFENSLEGMYRISPERRFLGANPAIASILGYESPEDLIAAVTDVRTQVCAYPEEWQCARDKMKSQGFLKETEMRCLRKDGSLVWLSFSAHPIHDGNGSVSYYQGMALDITDRKRIEAVLRESEEKFRSLVEHVPQSIFVKDRSSNYVMCNHVYAHSLSLEPEEIVGMSDYDLHPKELAEKYRADDRAVMESEKMMLFEEKYILFGKERWGWTTKIPYRDAQGNIIGIMGITDDITDRINSVAALKESEARFRRVTENSNDLIYRFSLPEGRFEYMSPAVLAISGYTREDHSDVDFIHTNVIHPDWRQKFYTRWEELLKGNVPPFHEFKIITKSGAERWLYQRDMIVTDEKGSPVAVEGIVTDITDRKEAEEELKKHRDRLEELVRERTGSLEEKSRTLEELNSALKVLLRQRDEDRRDLEDRFVSNVKGLITPYIEKMKRSGINAVQRSFLTILETNLNEVVSPFLHNLRQFNFTPREYQVADLIKAGKSTKEIAEVIGVAPSSVEAYRRSIREKLQLTRRKINLRTFLKTLT